MAKKSRTQTCLRNMAVARLLVRFPETHELRNASMKDIHDLAIRVKDGNPNHHLWNNNGVWWLHYTVYPTPVTVERVRRSLRTRSLPRARRVRDRYLRLLQSRTRREGRKEAAAVSH